MKEKKVAILQSNYIPWKGYFDMIAAVDEFILYDDMQYTRRDWRNRNQIKTPNGIQWLTVAVEAKGKYHQTIKETLLSDYGWGDAHWKTIKSNYSRAPYFQEISEFLYPLYHNNSYVNISQVNRAFIEAICHYLSIETVISSSSDYQLSEGKSERLVDLCLQADAVEYVSGPSAKNYIDELVFKKSGVTLSWFDYDGYPEYPQLWGSFSHGVSIIDLLFNCGKESSHYMRCVK
ncbi:WbqC family protein [Eionea flava]